MRRPGGPDGTAGADELCELLEAGGVRREVVAVHLVVRDDLVEQRAHQRHVRAGPRRQMHGGVPGWPSLPKDSLSAAAAPIRAAEL